MPAPYHDSAILSSMLSIFPEILFLAPFSALVLRAVLAVILTLAAWQHVRTHLLAKRLLGIIEAGTALALALGVVTQGAAVIATGLIIAQIAVPRARTFPQSTLWLALAISLSILVTGAGALAFDLPL